MRRRSRSGRLVFAGVLVALGYCVVVEATERAGGDAALPPGVRAVWDPSRAHREASATRERVCINGLWRWQPAEAAADRVPADGWGYFKVPGSWPGITAYNHKDSQTLHVHPDWQDQRLRDVTGAWYQREISVPEQWTGRRIVLYAEYVNSFATVYLDGRRVGEIRFPAGEVDLTAVCRPGERHLLSLHVLSMPLKAVMLAFSDTAAAREVAGAVARRGLCGDVYLIGTPAAARIADVRVTTSVRRDEITFAAELEDVAADRPYTLRAEVSENGQRVAEFTSEAFRAGDLNAGRFAFTADWKADKTWDIHTPENIYEVALSLLDDGGLVLDAALPARFGFQEFWIDGRDFYLNGTRIYLSALPIPLAQIGAAWANYDAAKESLLRLQSFGINFVYTHNYGCEPGTHLSFAEILRAADDVGMLVSLSQPHFGHYDWDAADADRNNGYAEHAAFYARVAGNHPSVVFYSTSHNATGYAEDMNPDMIDGIQDARSQWAVRNVQRALRAEAIIQRLDPDRIVYHHSSGNLGSMHTSNFYPNWVPIQEMSDWFEHWATRGVKPLFTCEYAAPFTWDWSMYRGWYQGKREFGSAPVPWEFCLAEWNAQFLGDAAYRISDQEKRNLRWEAQRFRQGAVWHRWDYPHQLGSSDFDERDPVIAAYLTDNWRAFRTWGLSANSPWEHGNYWRLRDGLRRGVRQEFCTDWDNLQRPGLSPDYIQDRYERFDLAYERSDWVATPAAEALQRNNLPLLAYIGGKPAAFTSQDHNFLPGESVEKQLIVINNSREPVTADCQWSLSLAPAVKPVHVAADLRDADSRQTTVTIPTGQQERIAMTFPLPADLAAGRYELRAEARFSNGQTQDDAFWIDVLPAPQPVRRAGRIALFDPQGETAALLKDLDVAFQRVPPDADLAPFDVFIVGQGALALDSPAPDISAVRDGLRVVIFEQTADVLERRFGFRVAEYGLREVFRRVPDHPLLAGLADEHLRNWRGDATILPDRLEYELSAQFNFTPTVQWCGIRVPRAWRAGNRGNVASALIEKPAAGDFLPILDGGYALQYTSLMEYREGGGMVLFCQTDVSGRTERDPAAQWLVHNILQYVCRWQPAPRRTVVYAGEAAGRQHLEATGLTPAEYDANLSADRVLVVGPGGAADLAADAQAIGNWIQAGGHVLAIGLSGDEASRFLPMSVRTTRAEHIAAHFPPFGRSSLLAGVSPAEVHNRDPRELPLITGGATAAGNGVLAKADGANVVFCQLAPWQFDPSGGQMNLKRTFRKLSSGTTRLLANMGAAGRTPLLERFAAPVRDGEQRWQNGFYLDEPEEWDDPYRFFRW
jgi:beta-galactosidase